MSLYPISMSRNSSFVNENNSKAKGSNCKLTATRKIVVNYIDYKCTISIGNFPFVWMLILFFLALAPAIVVSQDHEQCNNEGFCTAEHGHTDFHKWWEQYKFGPLVHKVEHYFDCYEKHLARLRAPQYGKVKMLEIGVQSGGSINLWKAYFGEKKVEYHGLDINPNCTQFEDLSRDIRVHIGSQADVSFIKQLAEAYGPFDFILDDGSHQSIHIAQSFKVLYSYVKPHGVYMVEDLMTNYWANNEFNEGFGKKHTFMYSSVSLIHQLNAFNTQHWKNAHGPRLAPNEFTETTFSMTYYDGILVFEKRPHAQYKDISAGSKSIPIGATHVKRPQNLDTEETLNLN